MGKWADRARDIYGEGSHANSANSAIRSPNGTFGTIGTGSKPALWVPPSEPEAKATLRIWHAALSALDFWTAPKGIELNRWQDLREDAWFLYEKHAAQLVRLGWSAESAFGVDVTSRTGSVLLDRLHRSRNLRLDTNGRAAWTWPCSSVVMTTCRGFAEMLPAGSVKAIWDL